MYNVSVRYFDVDPDGGASRAEGTKDERNFTEFADAVEFSIQMMPAVTEPNVGIEDPYETQVVDDSLMVWDTSSHRPFVAQALITRHDGEILSRQELKYLEDAAYDAAREQNVSTTRKAAVDPRYRIQFFYTHDDGEEHADDPVEVTFDQLVREVRMGLRWNPEYRVFDRHYDAVPMLVDRYETTQGDWVDIEVFVSHSDGSPLTGDEIEALARATKYDQWSSYPGSDGTPPTQTAPTNTPQLRLPLSAAAMKVKTAMNSTLSTQEATDQMISWIRYGYRAVGQTGLPPEYIETVDAIVDSGDPNDIRDLVIDYFVYRSEHRHLESPFRNFVLYGLMNQIDWNAVADYTDELYEKQDELAAPRR